MLNQFVYAVNIWRGKEQDIYVKFVTSKIFHKDVSSEIVGGSELAAVKAHRRVVASVNSNGGANGVRYDKDPAEMIHNLLLLRHSDELFVTIGFYRSSKLVKTGVIDVLGEKLPTVQVDQITERPAVLSLSKCYLKHLITLKQGYSVEIDVKGNAKLDILNETITKDPTLAT